MIYLLLLFLLFVIKIAFFDKKNLILKTKNHYVLNIFCQRIFFSKKNILFYSESKEYLKNYGFKKAKILDDILLKARINYINLEVLEFDKPTYFVGKHEMNYLKEVIYAKQIENLILYTDLKINNDEIICCKTKDEINKLNLLNLNKTIENIELFECDCELYFNQKLTKSTEYGSCYFLEKFENKNILILKYNFILNYKVIFIKIFNKNEHNNDISINFFYNLEHQKYNYFIFKVENNFISYKNSINRIVSYLNYNVKFDSCFFSKIKSLKLSNKPCLNLCYNFSLLPKENKNIVLCNADCVCDLTNIKIEFLYANAIKKKTEFFAFNFIFVDNELQTLFEKAFIQAQEDYLFGVSAKSLKFKFKELISSYKNNFITALDFYYNLVQNTISNNKNGYEINSDFIPCDFSILFSFCKKTKQIQIKKYCKSTAIIINGIRFFSSKHISFESLALHDYFLLETS